MSRASAFFFNSVEEANQGRRLSLVALHWTKLSLFWVSSWCGIKLPRNDPWKNSSTKHPVILIESNRIKLNQIESNWIESNRIELMDVFLNLITIIFAVIYAVLVSRIAGMRLRWASGAGIPQKCGTSLIPASENRLSKWRYLSLVKKRLYIRKDDLLVIWLNMGDIYR